METTQAHLTTIVAPVATPALPSEQPEITSLNFTGPPGFQVGNIKFGGGSPPSTEQLNKTSQLVRNALADLPQDLQIQALQSAIGERFYIQVRLKETPSKRLTEQSLDKKRKTQKRVTTLSGGHDKTTGNVPLVQATVLETSMEAYPTAKSTPDDAQPVQLDPDTNSEDWHMVTYKKKRRRKESFVPPVSRNTGGNPPARAKQPNRWEFEYKIRLTHSQTSIKPILHLLQMQLTPISKDFTLHLIEKSNIISLRTNCKNVAEAVEQVTHFSLNSQQVPAQVFRTYGATYMKGVIYDIFPLEEDPKDETLNSDLEKHGYAAQRDRAPCLRTYNRQSTALNDHAELDPDEHRTLIRNECRIRLEELLPEDPDPLPSGLGRRAGVLLRRIRTDTTVDPARIATWSQNKSSGLCQRCKLGARATFAHLAWSCPDLAAVRSRHRPLDIIQLESWTHPPGTEGARKRVLRTLLDFVFEAGLQAHI
ncbi:hypothetical protein HPB47_017988 [Ixodes persulcatus]|uniref:Uncharacterized protein n=1 Tax=Ixodes persulcatus TaxID=34615 RepID=A0AC60QMP5_IXOPE|nr:hypothetical protein HPB47_017988 [Ixodes persulcatus]